VALLEDPHEAEAFFRAPHAFYCVMRREAYDEFVSRGAPLTMLYEREGMSSTSGRVLWRAQMPTIQFVVAGRAQ